MLYIRIMQEQPCIICNQEGRSPSIEHIVPQSLGNIHYILYKGLVCKHCNNKIARIESTVLNSRHFLEKRKPHLLDGVHNKPASLQAQQRFLMKMVYEGLYASRKSIWTSLDHDRCRHFILNGGEWPFRNIKVPNQKFKPVPKLWNAFLLKRNKIFLGYFVSSNQELYGQFKYHNIRMEMRIQ